MSNKFRDPIHGYIEVSDLENKIINTPAFQRLRNIKQLGLTHMVFHGAEHSRFGHSIGVMHLVTRAFNAAIENGSDYTFPEEKKAWYTQILRLIGLTHDIGHAPFSHASEDLFPNGLKHEDYTELIIKETKIADIINEIGKDFTDKYGEGYEISPELICNIYLGRDPGENNEFTFLKSFMDSELDCDKMDYLLRDSYYCGVNYGRFDMERLISCLTIYVLDKCPRLAINSGGVQAFEEFVLARYFMFIQVYFHRTRRFFDIMLSNALSIILKNGTYPECVDGYLTWDDAKVIQLLKENVDKNEAAKNIIKRLVHPMVLETKTHPANADKNEFKLIREIVFEKFKRESFTEDYSADKMPHKIPTKTEVDDEKAIVIVDKRTGKCSTISEDSHIIRHLTDKINIMRLYVTPELKEKVTDEIKNKYKQIQE